MNESIRPFPASTLLQEFGDQGAGGKFEILSKSKLRVYIRCHFL
jgi:hypothetical protein